MTHPFICLHEELPMAKETKQLKKRRKKTPDKTKRNPRRPDLPRSKFAGKK